MGWEWAHPFYGTVKKIRACHKDMYDYIVIPDEKNPSFKLGPFLRLAKAKQEAELYFHQRNSNTQPNAEQPVRTMNLEKKYP